MWYRACAAARGTKEHDYACNLGLSLNKLSANLIRAYPVVGTALNTFFLINYNRLEPLASSSPEGGIALVRHTFTQR